MENITPPKGSVENGQELRCNIGGCWYTTSTESVLKTHLKYMHNRKRPKITALHRSSPEQEIHGIYMCHKCAYTTSTQDGLRSHLKLMHHLRPEKDLSCPLCRFKTARQVNLRLHVQRAHDNTTRNFMCRLCSYESSEKTELAIHVHEVHVSVGEEGPERHHRRDQRPAAGYSGEYLPDQHVTLFHGEERVAECQGKKNCKKCENVEDDDDEGVKGDVDEKVKSADVSHVTEEPSPSRGATVELKGKMPSPEARTAYECLQCGKRKYGRFHLASHIKRVHKVWGDTSRHIRKCSKEEVQTMKAAKLSGCNK